ncbi:MAG: LamG domain-containing protein [Oscillospiraceae bacterium]|nr:LamG domain-containing protein [Oscillospiraceae bacterium]
MKKSLAAIAAFLLATTMTACGDSTPPPASTTTAATEAKPVETTTAAEETTAAETTTSAPETETTEETKAPVAAEPIPEDPLYHLDFETADGLRAVMQAEDLGSLTGANFGLAPSDHPILIAEGQGAVGNALYLDGKYGVDFDMNEIADDSYTVSFWYNADRVAKYGPVVQLGRNIGMSNADATVTWLNVTKTDWGANNAEIFPVVWNRNSSIGTDISADGVWPWIYAMDDTEHGKREWCLITIVSDGNRYTADDGMERVGTKFYLNGELMHEANAENMFYQGLSPEILTGDGVEAHIGINYWDTIYKGFIDELYIFDEPLTDGQVKTLFEMGNPPEKPEAPEYDGGGDEPAETEAAPLAAAPVDTSAIDTLGTPERVLGFWGDTTDGFELADGASLKFKLNNYSDGVNNWDNFVMAFSNTAVKTDSVASADNYPGYAEYAVLRADAYGWGDESYNATFETSWGEDWAGWLSLMTDADVDITVTRNGGEVTAEYTFTGADGTAMTEKAVVTSTMAADSPVFVHFTGEAAYIELLSAE